MNTQRTLLLFVAVVGLLAMPAAAQVAHVSLEANGVAFSPLVEYRALVLTVSGGGDVYRMEFGTGEQPFFALFDGAGYPLADDSYTWELKVMPVVDDVPNRTTDEGVGITAKAANRGNLSQSGYFFVRDGAIVTAVGEEPARLVERNDDVSLVTRDQVINDDLIVTQSACIGQDCVNGESFGFDTLRLKENNLRIKFDDTSNSASFPNNDWQLTANDSSNGGANKFSIEDVSGGRIPFTIEASAPANSLYVDDGGRIGLGTSTPVVELHVVDGDTPTLRLEQDGSSGFTPQTWDLAGNETNFFVRDATNGSRLPFKIRPSAPTNSLYVDTDGDIGFGTSSPADHLHVNSTDNVTSLRLSASGGAMGTDWRLRSNSVNGTFTLQDGTTNDSSFKIEQGAGDNRIFIASNGAVGINTSAPNASAALDVDGPIFQRGASLHADYVFEPGYELESIAEHTSAMYANGHLPAVPPRQVDAQGREILEIGAHRRGMLEELEKAHIYIDQLHQAIRTLEARLDEIESDE